MSIIPTSYIRHQIALHAAVNRAREIGDRAPTLANLLDLDAACSVIDQLDRGTEAAISAGADTGATKAIAEFSSSLVRDTARARDSSPRSDMLPVPSPAATLACARELLTPRAQAGLAALPAERQATTALPAERQATTASAIAAGAYLTEWDRALSAGQPWPDTIEGTP